MDSAPASPVDDLIGTTLVDRFLITGKLGQGGMGSIYTAHDSILDRDVAIKTIARNNLSDVELVRFHRETKAASTVSHPNVIQMLDFGILASGQPFMVMELIKGLSIADLLKERGPQPAEFTLRVIEQVASGMISVHRAGIVHRDLKTGNIMLLEAGLLTNQPLVKILDFGIAKSLDATAQGATLTQAGQIFGSPNYMSPEQARGGQVDQKSDVYSLGCIAFEMLTGRNIFQGETVVEVLTKQISEPAPRLWEVANVQFPMELERLVAHMVAKDPQDRFTMEECIRNCREVMAVVVDETEKTGSVSEKLAPPPVVLNDTIMQKRAKVSTARLFTGLAVASVLLIASIFAVGSKVWSAKKVSNNVVTERRERSKQIERSQYLGEIIDKFGNEAEEEGFSVHHSGYASDYFDQLVKKKKTLNDLVLIDSELRPGDSKKIALLKPKKLNLGSCKGVDDQFLKDISEVKSISQIQLDFCKGFTPAGLSYLSKLPQLTFMSLEGCGLTDDHLKAMKNINTLLYIRIPKNPKVTLSGIRNLGNKVLPITVIVDQPHICILPREKKLEYLKSCNVRLTAQTDMSDTQGGTFITKFGLEGLDESFGPAKVGNPEKFTKNTKRAEELIMRNFD